MLLDRQARPDIAPDAAAKGADRVVKILPRLAASSDVEALQGCRALCKELAASGRDLHDLADAVKNLFEVKARPEAVPKATWTQMSPALQARWLMKLAKAEFLDAAELSVICSLADHHALTPGRDRDHAALMNGILKRWRARYGE
jgi:hypothetical protein